MTSPSERAAARALADARAVAESAVTLRHLGAYDNQTNTSRAALTYALAGLVEAVSRHHRTLPTEIAHQALRVAEAADRATGGR